MGRGLRAMLQFRPLGFTGPCLSTVVTVPGWLCVLGPAAGPLCASEGAAVWARQPPLLVPALRPSRAPSWHREARGLALCDPRGQCEASVLGDLGLEECLSGRVHVCPRG